MFFSSKIKPNKEESPNIRKLKVSTAILEGLIKTRAENAVDYNLEAGECRGKALLNTEIIAIQDCYFEGNFPLHTHKVIEILVVYEGSITVIVQGKKTVVETGESITIPANTEHEVICNTSFARIIGITIPPSRGYP